MCFYDLLTYEIIPLKTPYVIRNCSKCKRDTEFYCSEKFRVNANQKMVDVWIIYNCIHCEGTWNYPILSRVHVSKINPNLYQKFMNNHNETAWYYAFQIHHLRKLCKDVDTNVCYDLRMERFESKFNDLTIRINCNYDLDLRIDKVLAEILGVSRSNLKKLEIDGRLNLNPNISMKKRIIDHLQVTVVGKG